MNAPVDMLAVRAAEILSERLDDGSPVSRETLALRIARLEQRETGVPDLLSVAATMLKRIEMEHREAIFPNSAVREDLRAALAGFRSAAS